MAVLFKIKICGVTRTEDVETIAAAGADAIGINLVASSPRSVSHFQGRILAQTARDLKLHTVVVLMDPSPHDLLQVMDTLEPSAVQLHGSEVPSAIANCRATSIVKALTWTGRVEESVLAAQWTAEAARIDLSFLVDAYAPGIGGGTGKVARWDLLKPKPTELANVPMLLAGGLTPENVAEAIRATGCVGVDTASGVESAPGIKDKSRIEAFVQAAHAAFTR